MHKIVGEGDWVDWKVVDANENDIPCESFDDTTGHASVGVHNRYGKLIISKKPTGERESVIAYVVIHGAKFVYVGKDKNKLNIAK